MNALLRIAPLELLSLWEDLLEAEHGTNGFGGDTAEIYAYRMGTHGIYYYEMLRRPDGLQHPEVVKADLESALVLYELLCLFQDRRQVDIEVDGVRLAAELASQRFGHRVHVCVLKRARG